MVELPPELWWRIAQYANAILVLRRVRRDICRLRPERSLVYRYWDWLIIADYRRYATPKYFLSDLAEEVEARVWPVVFDPRYRDHRPVYWTRRPCVYKLRQRHTDTRDRLRLRPRLTTRRVHAAYRLPPIVVRWLRRNHRWSVLALIY